MRRPRFHHHRAGFSLLELIISLTVAALIFGNIALVHRSSAEVFESGVFGNSLEDRADTTMDRISFAIMSTSSDKLDDVLTAPGFVSSIEYEVITDVAEGARIEGTLERIEFQLDDGRIVWRRNPGAPDEQNATWARWVPEFLEGEEANGKDDNNNGVTDEEGLAFVKDIDQIVVRLTLTRTDSQGVEYTRTRSRRVTCRN